MRAWLWLALGASLALSAWAVSRHSADEPVLAIEAVDQSRSRHGDDEPSQRRDWAALRVEPALGDPFAAEPVALQSPPPPPEPALELPAIVEAPPPPPPQPMADYRYLGAITTPSRQRLTVLARGTSSVVVRVGTVLDDGYIVESAGPGGVRLVQPRFGKEVLIPVPRAGIDQ